MFMRFNKEVMFWPERVLEGPHIQDSLPCLQHFWRVKDKLAKNVVRGSQRVYLEPQWAWRVLKGLGGAWIIYDSLLAFNIFGRSQLTIGGLVQVGRVLESVDTTLWIMKVLGGSWRVWRVLKHPGVSASFVTYLEGLNFNIDVSYGLIGSRSL